MERIWEREYPLFPLNEREGLEFCEEMTTAGLDGKVVWLCETNIKSVTDRLLKEMRRCGCKKIIFGIESANEKILKYIGKTYTQQDILDAIKMANKSGIETIGLSIIGFPGETKEMIKETIRFPRRSGLRYAKFNLLVPYPGTRIYNFIKARNEDALPATWHDYIPYPFLANASRTYSPDRISKGGLNKLQRKAYFKFYCQPSILWPELCKLNFKKTLRRLTKALLKIPVS